MPKRIPTPPPADDEPRYLSVVHPFALHGHCNMELPKDRQDFARWVACVIDKDAFYAFFHKPSARDMVIIEVSRDYQHFDRILGEHRWSEFLVSPTKDLEDQISRVYYCTYSTGRQVQKYGWKRVYVEDQWFKSWSPRNGLIVSPYPPTRFCDMPVEDRTNEPLCRPLPGAIITPPPDLSAAPAPVVGSKAWIATKGVNIAAPKPKIGAWSEGAPKLPISPHASRSTSTPSANTSTNQAKKRPAVGGGPISIKASDVTVNKSKASQGSKWDIPHATNLTKPGTPVNDWDSPTGSAPSPAPSSSSYTRSDAAKPPASVWGKPPPLASPVSSWAAGPPGLPPRTTDSKPTTPGLDIPTFSRTSSNEGSVTTDSVEQVVSPDQDEYYKWHGYGGYGSPKIHAAMEELLLEDPECLDRDALAPSYHTAYDQNSQRVASPDGETQDLWGDEWDTQEQQKKSEVPLCVAHGVICKKGICQEYAKQLREIARVERFKKREADAAEAKSKKKQGKKKVAEKETENGWRTCGSIASKTTSDATSNSGVERAWGGKGGGAAGPGERGRVAFRGKGAPVRTNWKGAARPGVVPPPVAQAAPPNPAPKPKQHEDSWGVDDWDDDDGPSASNLNMPPPAPITSWADEVEKDYGGAGNSTKGRARAGSDARSVAQSTTSGWGTISEGPW